MTENPYSQFSTLAHPPRFVGRRRQLLHLGPALRGFGSRAVVGMPRVGKSSLALTARLASEADGGPVEWLDVGTLGVEVTLVQGLLHLLQDSEEDPEKALSALKGHLGRRRRTGDRTVVVLDEFDAVRLTRDASLSVRRLRELLINPGEYGLTCILVCRRELGAIEESVPELSNLANACPSVTLHPFTGEELAALERRGFPGHDTGQLSTPVARVSGGVPVLAEEAFFHLFEGVSEGELVEVMRSSTRQVVSSWEQLLIDLGLWGAYVEFAASGRITRGIVLERLVDYGIIEQSGGSFRSTFDALVARAREVPGQEAWVTDE